LLKDITRLASPRFSSDRTIDSIMEHLRAFYSADTCGLIQADQSIAGHHLLHDAHHSPKAAVDGEPMPTELARILGAVLPEQIAVYCGGRHTWRWWCPWASEHVYDVIKGERVTDPPDTNDVFAAICGRRSLIVVPLCYQGEIVSWLYLALKRRHAFSMLDVDFLHQVVKHIEPILDNSRLVDRLAMNAADEERRRIARDLHDSVIQAHIGLQIGLDAIRRKLVAGGTEVVKDIDHLIEMIDAGVVDLRCYVRGLKDGGEPVGELLPAVQRFARRFAEVTGIAVHVKTETDICVNGRLAAEAFQTVAEGLSNVRRHTNAVQATVSLACSEGHLILRIENEGTDGWAPFTPRSITERAEALGGQARVERREDNGTTVLVTIPL
jgi:signal transduction histidine kinase